MKRLLIALTLAALPLTALAQTTPDTSQRLARLKTKADAEINRRVTSLNTLSTKIAAAQHLTSGDRATLTSQVTGELSGLASLKTKIDNDTDLDVLRTDVKSIVTEYRVYCLIVPKVALTRAADAEVTAASKLLDLAAKLQTHIDQYQAAGKDVAALQTLEADLKAKAAVAQATAQGVETAIINITPTDFDANTAVLTGRRDQLKTARQDLQAARSDARSIVDGLNRLKSS